MATIPNIDIRNLAAISGLVVLLAVWLWWLRVSIVNQLLLATARAIGQVLMLGIFATVVVQAPQPLGGLGGCILLLLAVSIATSNRLGQTKLLPLVGGALLVSTLTVMGYVQLFVIQLPIAHSSQYLLALVGILLANSPVAIIGIGQQFFQVVEQERNAIETHLSLGATSRQAILPYCRTTWQQGCRPIIQNLAVTGLIIIPTLMAGLILAGVSPLLAAAYQIVVLLMVLVHQILTAVLVVQGLSMSIFHQHQLLETIKTGSQN
jgi:putative ABC transport system permease protein